MLGRERLGRRAGRGELFMIFKIELRGRAVMFDGR